MGVGGQRHAPAALPPGKTRYPLYRRLGGPQSRSRQVRKTWPPQEVDPRIVQPVASRYTNYAARIHRVRLWYNIKTYVYTRQSVQQFFHTDSVGVCMLCIHTFHQTSFKVSLDITVERKGKRACPIPAQVLLHTATFCGVDTSLAQPGRKQATFPTFYGPWRFITTFTRVHRLSLP